MTVEERVLQFLRIVRIRHHCEVVGDMVDQTPSERGIAVAVDDCDRCLRLMELRDY